MTQEFVAPTRTNLYWYSPEGATSGTELAIGNQFRGFGDSRTSAPGLTVAEANDFYQALAAGQLVAIGAGRSLLNSESTERFLARLRTRSLLAAPIQAKGNSWAFWQWKTTRLASGRRRRETTSAPLPSWWQWW
jgi:hypothetical protein